MKRWVLAALAALVAAVALLFALGLIVRSLVTGNALVARLSDRLGTPVSVGASRFDLIQWMRLQPSIALEDVAIGNPKGFRQKHLLAAGRMSAQIELLGLLHGTLRVRSIGIERPRIVVEEDGRGGTNVEAFLKGLAARKPESGEKSRGGGTALAIGRLRLAAGQIVMAGGQGAGLNLHDIDLELTGFEAGRPARIECRAKLFPGPESSLRVAGKAGPLGRDSLPLDGTLAITVAPHEMPAAWRQRQFGKLLGAPGKQGRARLEAVIAGDLFRTVSGPATLALSEILIGKDPNHRMPLEGEVPASFSGSNLMGKPHLKLAAKKAALRLGKGEWAGSAEAELRGTVVSGSSSGAIRNVEINEFVSSLTDANEKIFGLFEMPSYVLRFGGRTADEIRNSLEGRGELRISKGRIRALDLLASLQRALHSRQETAGEKGDTPFTTLTADLSVGERKLVAEKIAIQGPLRATGRGAIGFDQALDFDLEVLVRGEVGQLVNRTARRDPSAPALVPVAVTGTVAAPRVRPDFGRLMKGTVKSTVKGLFESLLKRR